jgi:hypothetical protein
VGRGTVEWIDKWDWKAVGEKIDKDAEGLEETEKHK